MAQIPAHIRIWVQMKETSRQPLTGLGAHRCRRLFELDKVWKILP